MLIIRDPVLCIIRVQSIWMFGQELLGLRPKRRNCLGRIVQVDREAIGFVAVLHIAENVVVYVAEEMDVGLNAPVILCMLQSWMFVEKATVPTAHLMVGCHGRVLYSLFLEDFGGFLKEVIVDPAGHIPMFFWDQFCRN